MSIVQLLPFGPVPRWRRAALAGAAALAIGAGAVAQEPPADDHEPHPEESVRILGNKLRPAVLEIDSEDSISWLNYSRFRAVVSFPRETGKHLTCTSRGTFRLTGERLESAPIQAYRFASLCTLAPGTYEYEVSLSTGVGAGALRGQRTLEGTIVVTE